MIKRILNIFCDASVITKENGEKQACARAQAIETCRYFQMIIPGGTNNAGEAMGLLLAVYLANMHKETYDEINIFCDSKITVLGIREWVFNWKLGTDNVYYGSAGTPIANACTLIAIVRYILRNNLNVNIYHQKGHVSDVKKAIDVFVESNKTQISYNDAQTISYYNDMVDKLSRDGTSNCEYLDMPFIKPLTDTELTIYKNLISLPNYLELGSYLTINN